MTKFSVWNIEIMMILLKEWGNPEKDMDFLNEEFEFRHVNCYLYVNGIFIVYIESSYFDM